MASRYVWTFDDISSEVRLEKKILPVNFKPSPNRSILQNTSAGGGEAMMVPLLRPVRVVRRRRSVSSISMKIHEGEVEFRSQHASFLVGAAWIS